MEAGVDFKPERFVNREPERELWKDILNETEKYGRFWEFTGIAGQGKSELLKYFYIASKQEEKVYSVYLDFDKRTDLDKRKFYRPEIYPLLEEITMFLRDDVVSEEIFSRFDMFLTEYLELFRYYQEQLWSDPEAADRRPVDKKEEELIEAFKEDFGGLLANYKIALCFDSTERAYPGAMQKIEEYLFQPFIKNDNLILVFAGQQKWTWTLRELRRQIERRSLEPLSKEDSKSLIDTLLSQVDIAEKDREELLDKMWKLTLGHPFSSCTFLEFLSGGRKSLTKTIIDEYYRPSIKELIDKVIRHRILERLELSPAYPEPEIVLSCLAPLRRIEFSTFHFILSRFLPDKFQDKPFLFFEELIAEFQKQSHIFTPWILGAGFDVEPVTRNILLEDLRLNNKEQFVEIQEAVIEQYERWIEQTRDASQIKNIIERLYHKILLLKEEKKKNINETIEDELKEFIHRIKLDTDDPIQIRDQITRLKNALDRDKELNEMINVRKLIELVNIAQEL